MRVLPADQFPGAEKDPLSYPGARPDFSYVYYQGKVYEITPRGDTLDDLWVGGEASLDDFLAARGNPFLAERHAVLAVGSNGCPGRLAEKYAHQPEVAIPVFVGTLSDTAVVYSRRVARYGALPATYLRQPDAVSWLSLTMLDGRQAARMDETEDLGEIYLRVSVPGWFHMDGNGPRIGGLTAYLDREVLNYMGTPIRLKLFAREGPDWPVMDEAEVLSLVLDEAGLLLGESVEARHGRLVADPALRERLLAFLEAAMGGLVVDEQGRLAGG